MCFGRNEIMDGHSVCDDWWFHNIEFHNKLKKLNLSNIEINKFIIFDEIIKEVLSIEEIKEILKEKAVLKKFRIELQKVLYYGEL
jgi:hypothetical protein